MRYSNEDRDVYPGLLASAPERVPMLVILALAASLLGGAVTPSEILPGGPSITATAETPVVSPSIDNGLPGGPS